MHTCSFVSISYLSSLFVMRFGCVYLTVIIVGAKLVFFVLQQVVGCFPEGYFVEFCVITQYTYRKQSYVTAGPKEFAEKDVL